MAAVDSPPAAQASAPAPSRFKLLPLADGYIGGGVLGATIRSIGWFAGLFLAFALLQAARSVATADTPWAIALQVLALQIPRIVLFTIPASLLYGTVSTFTEMSARGEYTAFMGGGMSLARMMRTPLLLALALAGLAFWLQEVVVPGVELRRGDLTQRAALAILSSQKFKPLVDSNRDGTLRRIVQATKFDVGKQTLLAPTIQLFRPDGTVGVEIKARSASWDGARRSWVFQQGTTKTYGKGAAASVVVPFEELALQTDVAPAPDSLSAATKDARDQLERKNYEMVSWRQLAAYRAEKVGQLNDLTDDEKRDARKVIRAATYGIHDKLAMPLVVLAMVLVGAPLGVRPQRTASAGLAMGLSLMVILGYYLIWTLCTQIGKAGSQGPLFLAYLPAAALALTGTVLLWRKS